MMPTTDLGVSDTPTFFSAVENNSLPHKFVNNKDEPSEQHL